MAHLYHNTSFFRVGYLFKVGVSEPDLLNDELPGLGLYEVTDVVWVFSEDESASLSKFKENTTKGEGKTSKASPENTKVCRVLFLEYLNWISCQYRSCERRISVVNPA